MRLSSDLFSFSVRIFSIRVWVIVGLGTTTVQVVVVVMV